MIVVAARTTRPATTTLARASSRFFHHLRVSVMSYARFSASIRPLKMFDPAHAASRAPTDISPGAPSASTTSLMTPRTRSIASPGSVPASWDITRSMICCLSPRRPRSGAANRKSGKSEKKK
jgi:hypothetical protein